MRPFTLFNVIASVLFSLPLSASADVADQLPALDCIINPSEKIDLSSLSAGVITEVLVRRGDAVTQGQKIAQLDDRVEQVSVMLAEARAAIESELEGGQINLDYDRYAYKRLTNLYHSKAVSEQDKEQAERAVKLSSAAIKQAREQAKIRELELYRAQTLLEQRIVRSPVDGVVQRNLKFRGEYVDEDPVVRIVTLDPLYIETMVPIKHFGSLQRGMLAEVYPEVLSQEAMQARVIAIDPVGDVGSSAFGVQLEMANPDKKIPAGIKCDLKFTGQLEVRSEEEQESETSKVAVNVADVSKGSDQADDRTENSPVNTPETKIEIAEQVAFSENKEPEDQEPEHKVSDIKDPEVAVPEAIDADLVAPETAIASTASEQMAVEQKEVDRLVLGKEADLSAVPATEESTDVVNELTPVQTGDAIASDQSQAATQATTQAVAQTAIQAATQAVVQTAIQATNQVTTQETDAEQEPSVVLKSVVLGPYKTDKFQQVSGLLNTENIAFTTETSEEVRKIGYILLLRGSKQALATAVTELRSYGLKDVEYLNYGAYKGSVSLGVFYNDRSANERSRLISRYGYQPEQVTRFRKQSLVTVLADIPAGDNRLEKLGL
ncbi:efflux RND transporter periplasmic adaptor subunit [Amphritea balenae]|uniref:efflux RND transporter periplasmic adaptor subunit n=1 Tax=Amphritea balenae TaxID=452629 RepID=UPI001472C6DC|nr:efflux RND transporter periplasmic adaptor subunit [Amphritea balenae]GGK85760.1 hypothetical protein GCM10007941_40280 [Amphritea balenae]